MEQVLDVLLTSGTSEPRRRLVPKPDWFDPGAVEDAIREGRCDPPDPYEYEYEEPSPQRHKTRDTISTPKQANDTKDD